MMDPEQKAKMNAAAAEAEKEFYTMFADPTKHVVTVDELIAWGKKHYPHCGYKRLGLIVSQRENFSKEV